MSIRAVLWARDVCVRFDVPPSERLILFAIAMHHHDKTGECFPAYDTLSDHTGFSKRRVIYGVADLVANGLIVTQTRRVKGHQGSNHFVLFGMPKGHKWATTRVHKKAPCESEQSCTLPRVHARAPDREEPYYRGEAQAKKLRVVNGGLSDA